MGGQSKLAILGLQTIDVNRSVGGLGRDKFIERIPCDTLHIVGMLRNLPYHLPWKSKVSAVWTRWTFESPGASKTNHSVHCRF